MLIEIVSSGEPRRTIVRDADTGEEINRVVSVDIHIGLEGSYANLLISHPIIKYVGQAYTTEDYVTIEKTHANTTQPH